MPVYEFRCQQCDERFEQRRAMRDADAPASCSSGHQDTVRLLPVFSTTGLAPVHSGCGAGGGCCGGACGAA